MYCIIADITCARNKHRVCALCRIRCVKRLFKVTLLTRATLQLTLYAMCCCKTYVFRKRKRDAFSQELAPFNTSVHTVEASFHDGIRVTSCTDVKSSLNYHFARDAFRSAWKTCDDGVREQYGQRYFDQCESSNCIQKISPYANRSCTTLARTQSTAGERRRCWQSGRRTQALLYWSFCGEIVFGAVLL